MKISRKKNQRTVHRRASHLLIGLFSALFVAIIISAFPLFAEDQGPRQGVTFWLLDDNGNWKVPLPNWSVDDVTAFLDQNAQTLRDPSGTIVSLEIDGHVDGQHAYLSMLYDISLNLSPGQNGPVRVSLGMKEGVYRPEGEEGEKNFTAEGPGQVFLDVDSETGGYAVIIYPDSSVPPVAASTNSAEESPSAVSSLGESAAEGDPSGNAPSQSETAVGEDSSAVEKTESPSPLVAVQNYTVRLNLVFMVTQAVGADEFVLLMTPPPALSSQARIVVPLFDAEVSTSEGVLASAPKSLDEKSSELRVYGFNRNGAATAIRWRPEEKNEASLPPVYRIENAVIDLNPTGDGIEYDVTLPIRIFGGSKTAPNRLQIELPSGAHLDMQKVRVSSGGNDVPEAVCREIPASDVSPLPAVEVLVPNAIDSLVLRLAASIPIGEKKEDEKGEEEGDKGRNRWECTGFHLKGAQKETGEIIVHLPDDESVLSDLVPGTGVRDAKQPETTEGSEKIARFRFYKQPFSLKSDPIPRRTRLIAQPEYQVLISGQEMRLKARVAYSVYGAPLRSVRIKNSGWFSTGYTEESGVDPETVYDDQETGETVFPLKKPVEGDFTLTWESVKDLNGHRDTLDFGLPDPVADWVASPTLVVVPDDNIELRPLPGKLRGLVQTRLSPDRQTIELPLREQSPLVYQVQREGVSDGESPFFAARFIPHAGDVSVQSFLTVRLDRNPPELVQTLEYRVRYVPIRSLDFTLTEGLLALKNPEFFLDGKPVAPEIVSVKDDPEINGNAEGIKITSVSRSVRLPNPGRIGSVRLELRSQFELPSFAPEQSTNIDIPLVIPSDVRLENNAVEVSAPLKYSLHLPEQTFGWKDSGSEQNEGARLYKFTAGSFSRLFPLRAEINQNSQMTGGLTADYIWAQTFLGHDSYFERICCRISGNQPAFMLELPEGADRNQMAVSVDGVPAVVDYLPEKRILQIPLPETAKTEPSLVSIWYLIPRGNHELEFPNLMKQTMIRRCYLQLVLPSGAFLRQIPRGWSSEGNEYGRCPKTVQLAESVGMRITDGDEPPRDANVYLLSSFDPPQRVHIHLISKATILLLGSGLVLFFGSLCIYRPKHWKGVLGFLIVLLAVSAFLFRPQIILFCLQFMTVGVFLLLVVIFLKHRFGQSKPAVASPRQTPAMPVMTSERSSSKTASHKSTAVGSKTASRDSKASAFVRKSEQSEQNPAGSQSKSGVPVHESDLPVSGSAAGSPAPTERESKTVLPESGTGPSESGAAANLKKPVSETETAPTDSETSSPASKADSLEPETEGA